MRIASKRDMEEAALHYGMLPFFSNDIHGFSVQEMAAPGMLFGGTSDDDGCWVWKGPVIREQTSAYGKFFKRKAGFVSLDLFPDFLNYRRYAYPLKPDSIERMILSMIRQHEALTSTELRRLIFGTSSRKRTQEDLVSYIDSSRPKRHGLEAPLQRLQMGGWLLIADFEYKYTSRGDRYGWGVAVYSTPEILFGPGFTDCTRTPQESFKYLVDRLVLKLPDVSPDLIRDLIR